jgi:hypothetical protein
MSHRPLAVIAVALVLIVGACSPAPAASFDPTGPCVTDGSSPGAYPDLEALVPKLFQSVAPTTLDSGRTCPGPNLGSLASAGVDEVRFGGGTWTFGAERAAVLAVFQGTGLTADAMADFYANSAHEADRTDVLAESSPTVAGRPGRRLDTQTGERLQTVVVWPSSEVGRVNVVITNDLPDARIQDALDAFGTN